MPHEILSTKPVSRWGAPRNVFLNHRTGEYCIRVAGGRGARATYVSLKTKDREEAMRRLARTGVEPLVEVADDERFKENLIKAVTAGDKVAISRVVDEWLAEKASKLTAPSLIHPRTISSQFMQLYGPNAGIDRPTAAEANEWINTAPTLSRRQRRMTVLSDLFKFAFEQGYRKDNLGSRFGLKTGDLTMDQMERQIEPPFTQEEYEKLMACPDVKGFWRWSIQFSWWIGLRMSDCARMQWGSFCSVPGKLVCWQQKTRKRIELDLSDPLLGGGVLLGVIEEMKQDVQDAVFCFPEAKDILASRRSALVDEFRRICAMAGLDGRKTWKCFRSAAAQRWSAQGRTLDEVCLMLGHTGTGNADYYLETTRK